MSSLFTDYGETARVYCYGVDREDARLLASGRARLALGPRPRDLRRSRGIGAAWPTASCTSATTTSRAARSAFPGAPPTSGSSAEIEEPFRQRRPDGDAAHGRPRLRVGRRTRCGSSSATSSNRSWRFILRSVLAEADAVYRELYEEHAPLMRFLSSHGIAQPRGFRMAAELALNTSLRRTLEAEIPDPARLVGDPGGGPATSASRCTRTGSACAVEHALERLADGLRSSPSDLERLEELEAVVDLARSACPSRWTSGRSRTPTTSSRADCSPARRREAAAGFEDAAQWVERFLALGEKLVVKVPRVRVGTARRASDSTGLSVRSALCYTSRRVDTRSRKGASGFRRPRKAPSPLRPLPRPPVDVAAERAGALRDASTRRPGSASGGNPVRLFREVPAERLWRAAEDPGVPGGAPGDGRAA